MDVVVPFTMEFVAFGIGSGELILADFDSSWIRVPVEFRVYLQTGFCGRRGDKRNDSLMVDERTATPVHCDVREQAVFNLVPLRRSRWKMTNRDR